MKSQAFLINVVDPGLEAMAGVCGIPYSPEARVLLHAIAGQESGWTERLQIGAPQFGRGWWMFEQNGVNALATNLVTEAKLVDLLTALDIPPVLTTVHEAVAWNDVLNLGMARLLLYSDPAPLPTVGDVQGAWAYYERNWKPGTPRPAAWPGNYAQAMQDCAAVGIA